MTGLVATETFRTQPCYVAHSQSGDIEDDRDSGPSGVLATLAVVTAMLPLLPPLPNWIQPASGRLVDRIAEVQRSLHKTSSPRPQVGLPGSMTTSDSLATLLLLSLSSSGPPSIDDCGRGSRQVWLPTVWVTATAQTGTISMSTSSAPTQDPLLQEGGILALHDPGSKRARSAVIQLA